MKDEGKEKSGQSMSGVNFNRRSWLKITGVGVALLAGGLTIGARAQLLPGLRPGAATPFQQRELDPNGGMAVVLLGTGTPIPNPDRACASTLVIAGDKAFIFDTGRGFLNNLAKAGIYGINAVFFTHYHSDHFGEFGEFMVTRAVQGADQPMPVIGPTGAKRVVGGIMEAYALDNSYRKAHHKDNWHEQGMVAEVTEASPGVVYDRDGVKVTMFDVDHAPIVPAEGYRIDYKGQSVVISGDTKKCAKVAEMAQGCDILVHEAINKDLIQRGMDMGGNMSPRMQALVKDMMDYHASTEEVAQIAADARVKKLVLTHMVPGLPPNPAADRLFTSGMGGIYKGPIVVGRDGMEINA